MKESNLNSNSLARRELRTAEKMRFRDLVNQVERFLKYATKGTDPEVLRREAHEFDQRLAGFKDDLDHRAIRKLHRRLREIYERRIQ